MPDIVTLTPNPAVDLGTSTFRVEPTTKLRCRAFTMEAGGGGINVARVVQRFGLRAAGIFTAGGVNGARLKELVKRDPFEEWSVHVRGETRESISVTDEATGAQYRFVLPGPTITPDEERAMLDALLALRPAPRYVVVSGSLPQGTSYGFMQSVAATAANAGASLVVDGPADVLRQCRGAYLVKPNLSEMEGAAGGSLPTHAARVEAARAWIENGMAKNVLISLGPDGALLVTEDDAIAFRSPSVRLVSAIGAGDSMVGGLVAALVAGQTLGQAVAQGVAAGAAALLTPGTELCRAEDVWRLLGGVTASGWTQTCPTSDMQAVVEARPA